MSPDTLRAPVLKVDVTPMNHAELLHAVDRAVSENSELTVLGHNLHSVYLMHTDPEFRAFYETAQVTLADGMPVLAALSVGELLAGRPPLSVTRRLGSTDWVTDCGALNNVKRVALLGASAASNRDAVARLRRVTPQAEYHGIPADPWTESSLQAVVEQLHAFAPQVLLVGMGMPLQERIMTALRAETEIPVIAAVGGALDQISGAQSLAPRWLGKIGMEWVWRLASDPRRLAGRYVVEPLRLATVLVRRPA